MIEQRTIDYNPNPTAIKIHNDDSFVRVAIGPVGCGKTHTFIAEILYRAYRQKPGADGVKRTRWLLVRNTYPDLKATTIDAWRSVFKPEIFGDVKKDIPMTHTIRIAHEDGDIHIEAIFMSLDRDEDVKKLGSLRVTGVFINELREIHKKVFTTCLERVGRYPERNDAIGEYGPTWWGVFADSNPPDTEHWLYKILEEEQPKGYKLFRYPPGLIKVEGDWQTNPEAENLDHLPHDYYVNMAYGKPIDEIKVQILGEYGFLRDGKPVHPSYNDNFHYSGVVLEPNPELEICLGWDFGLTPACAITQLSNHGKFEVIDELWSEDLSLREFAEHVVVPHLDRNYPFWRKNYISVHDPADSKGNEGHTNQQILSELGIDSYPAASNNNMTARRDGLDYFLVRMAGGQPAFSVSSKCKRIRKGLQSEFKYAKIKATGDDRYFDKPVKNMYSHICEALEYAAMQYARTVKEDANKTDYSPQFHHGNFMGR